jgi:transposase
MDTSRALVPAKRGKQERRYRRNAEKRRIVEEALSGGCSVAEVARRHGINTNLLFNWRRLYRQGLLDRCREPVSATLMPVRVTPAPPVTSTPPAVATGHIDIELPGEIRVRVHGRVEGDTLAEVLALLSAR